MTRTVSLRTPVPGPRSLELLRRREASVPRGATNVTPIFTRETRGATLTDVDGNVFLDFAGGIGVLNVGANHPEVVEAVKAQAEAFLHTCFHVTMYEPYVALAEAMNRLAPGAFPKKTLLVNSGAEAVENAIKIARRSTGRKAVLTFSHAFHGRTLLAMTLTAKVQTYKLGFGPFAPEVYRLPAPYPYRDGWTPEEASARALEAVRRAVHDEIGSDQVAALIIEPVQGEGGFIVQPPAFLKGLRELADASGILFIADEIQTGFGRTGRFFALEHAGVVPDILVTAKSLGDGLPIAAVTGRAEVMDAAQAGGLGGTYGGNPLACAAALKVIEVMERDRLVARAAELGTKVMAAFESWRERFPVIGDVRGLGAMAAIEFVRDRATREPATELTAEIARDAYENGLILMKAGDHSNVIRFLAPFALSDDQLEEGMGILEAAIARTAARLAVTR